MKDDTKTKKEKLIITIESIENENVLDYLLTYIELVLKRWG